MKKKESGDESAAVGVLKVTRWIVPCLSGHPQEQSNWLYHSSGQEGLKGQHLVIMWIWELSLALQRDIFGKGKWLWRKFDL